VALFKNISLKEKVSLQIKGEFYNLFNHPPFTTVNNTAQFDAKGNQVYPLFGHLTADLGPHQVRLAGRITFEWRHRFWIVW
jgi:hypothetical protein